MSRSTSATINSSWSNYSSDNDSGILAKLRRLKIQEGLLVQNINKTLSKTNDDGEVFVVPFASTDYKSYISNIRNLYEEIKSLFDSLKCNTASQQALKSYDIEDIKNDVLQLEAKIKKLKNYLFSEQASLKSQEMELIKQMNVTETEERLSKHSKIITRPFSEIVPSPVKRIISSPFKCLEVHELQEFLKAHHRYGGWNEYSHNIFVQTWIKHFQTTVFDSNLEEEDLCIEISNEFISEIIEKIPGVTKGDIIQHSKWYSKYLYLKRRQQDALNRWRAKKKIIQKTQSINKRESSNESKTNTICHNKEHNPKKCTQFVKDFVSDEMKRMEEMFSHDLFDESVQMENNNAEIEETVNRQHRNNKQENFKEKQRGLFHFAKSTQQWMNKCNDKSIQSNIVEMDKHQVENIEKLCVPNWRAFMKN